MRIVTAGCFDVLTVGHFNLLMYCRQLAGFNGEVIACLDCDDKIVTDKSRSPIFPLEDRCEAIKRLVSFDKNLVDRTFHHANNQDLEEIIFYLTPDLIVVGSDYREKKVIGSEIAKIVFFERDDMFSSTKIIEACRKQE